MLVVDTGVFLAASDDGDRAHSKCRALLEREGGPLVTTGQVIAEAGYLLDRQLGPAAEARFYRSLSREEIRVDQLGTGDWARVAELVDQYADLPLGGTDAGLIVLIERYEQRRVATLDRRHFGVVQPRTGPVEIQPV